ncbi:capsid maturation protease [Lake sturgeon herpesvirus]|nr:capsid maturation protease [Lake sturgeon herpesvirus]
MSVFHTTDHRVAVSKPGGGYTLYDLAKKQTEHRDSVERGEGGEAETVPVYCSQCFETPLTPYQKVLSELTPDGAYLVGTVGIFNDDQTDYTQQAYPQRHHEGDLAVNTLGRYHLSLSSLSNTHHLAPGEALYNHNTDGRLGEVLCYWHVHHPVKHLVGFNALVKVDNRPGQYGQVFWDTASEAVTGFSWGSLETAEGRLVAELSAVHIPGRKGCFARAVTGADDTKKALDGLCFGFEPCQTLRAGLFDAPSESLTGAQETDPVQKFLAHYKLSMDQYLSVNKLVYKHKGDTHIEQYLHKGIDDYKQLYGQTTTDQTVTNRLITANIMNAQQQPQQPSMPLQNPYYSNNNNAHQINIQDIMQRVEAKHKKQLETERREREQERHKQELDMLKNTVSKLQARLEETPSLATISPTVSAAVAAAPSVKRARVEDEERPADDSVTQRLNQITSYLQKLIEMPQTTTSIQQPKTPVLEVVSESVTIPMADYQSMKKMMEDINYKLSVPEKNVTPIIVESITPEATASSSVMVTANAPLTSAKTSAKRKQVELIDTVFANL